MKRINFITVYDCFSHINFILPEDLTVMMRINVTADEKERQKIFCMPFIGAVSYANSCIGNCHYYKV